LKVEGREFGFVEQPGYHHYKGTGYRRILYILLRCSVCGRGGIAQIHANETLATGALGEFYPIAVEFAKLPSGVPKGIEAEFREAERNLAFGASRSASAMFRSALEKALKANGYTKGDLQQKIESAAADGVITQALKQSAHDDVRVLGNDVLHDEWREVPPDEAEKAHHYAQRIIEAFYDQRPVVETVLRAKGRLPATPAVAAPPAKP
jgi:hypothetical protein